MRLITCCHTVCGRDEGVGVDDSWVGRFKKKRMEEDTQKLPRVVQAWPRHPRPPHPLSRPEREREARESEREVRERGERETTCYCERDTKARNLVSLSRLSLVEARERQQVGTGKWSTSPSCFGV